jgi:hypothetical protein
MALKSASFAEKVLSETSNPESTDEELMARIAHYAFIGALSIASMAIYTYYFPTDPYWHRLLAVFLTAVCANALIYGFFRNSK